MIRAYDDVLEQRGILGAAFAAHWEPHTINNQGGWLYPVPSKKHPNVKRWKAADSSADPKYLWIPAGGEKPPYYTVNGIVDAIAKAGGNLWIASGEPDVLAFYAAGFANVLCWFGEQNVPETLANDLKALGVESVRYAPDRDETGVKSCTKVRDLLEGSGIKFHARKLPGELGSHYDINKLWIDAQFDHETFTGWLYELPMLELPAPEGKQAELPEVDFTSLYEEWCQTVEEAAIRQWNITGPKKNDFSRRNIKCPFHGDERPSASWNYETHGLHCFAECGDIDTKRIAAELGVQSWESYRDERLPKSDNGTKAKTTDKAAPAKQDNTIRVVNSVDAMKTVLSWLDGNVPPSEPILSPYNAMHRLGGMAKLWERRKLIYIIGGSGLGKTAFMETGVDILNQRGFDVFVWGPEWSPEEVQMKRIARYGGPTFTEQREDHLFWMEVDNNTDSDRMSGKAMSTEAREKAKEIAKAVMSWPGQVLYLDKANVSIEAVMEEVIKRSKELREQGRNPAVFFCDYLQKSRLPQSAGRWNELEDKANIISYACIEANLVGVVASQVGKASNHMVRQNKLLDESSGQALSDQLCNLMVTLNPEFEEDGSRREIGRLVVAKNSSGFFPAQVRVKTALHRHFWTDIELPLPAKDEIGGGY